MAFADGPKVALADYKAGDPTGVPASLAKASLVERGAYLAQAADCMACHTTQGGKPYAGGLGFKLPFGTLYSTNITPDKETGIGNYSDQDFLNAVHRGIRRDGARLYPAMPFTSYTYMTDADALAIKAYLFSLPPVRAAAPANTLTFPFNQRWAMNFWSALFNPDTRFEPDTSKSPEWNRGAYLAEALAHCGECHTPRNLAFALNNRKKFAGAVTAGWRAFNIRSDKTTGIGAWRDDDLVSYLVDRTCGGSRHRRRDRWARRWTTASASWRRKTSAPSWPICAACPRSLRPICRRRWRRRRRLRTRQRRHARPARQDGVRRRLRQLPRLDRRKFDLALRHAYRRVGGQRSQCDQCRPDRDFRNQAAYAGGRRLDAGVRQCLFRRRNRGGRQLRHRALRQQAVAGHRAGRGGVTEASVAVRTYDVFIRQF